MNFEDFIAHRNQLRVVRPELVDCSELNVYRSLAKTFGPIAPSSHPEAPFRCHLAEQFLDRLELSRELKPRTQVSHGVRRSLTALFSMLGQQTVAIPSDVYPVYLQLAAQSAVKVVPYQARLGLPRSLDFDAILVCEPLKPWGTVLSEAEAASLAGRLVIIDSAYAVPPSSVALRMLRDEAAVLLVSLSKGWLIPDHAGLCIVPTRLQQVAREAFAKLPKNEQRIRIGYAALTEHSQRLDEVTRVLKARAEVLNARGLGVACVGYFASCDLTFEHLLERGILGVPASVFGSDSRGTVLSSLEAVGAGLS